MCRVTIAELIVGGPLPDGYRSPVALLGVMEPFLEVQLPYSPTGPCPFLGSNNLILSTVMVATLSFHSQYAQTAAFHPQYAQTVLLDR